MAATFPAASYMAFSAGTTLMVSAPFGVPSSPMDSVNTFPLVVSIFVGFT